MLSQSDVRYGADTAPSSDPSDSPDPIASLVTTLVTRARHNPPALGARVRGARVHGCALETTARQAAAVTGFHKGRHVLCGLHKILDPLKPVRPKSASLKGRDFLMVLLGHHRAILGRLISLLFFRGTSHRSEAHS